MFKTLRERIKKLEAQGYTGRTNPELDQLNRRQTNAMSDSEIRDTIRERLEKGKPVGKLVAAARERGISY